MKQKYEQNFILCDDHIEKLRELNEGHYNTEQIQIQTLNNRLNQMATKVELRNVDNFTRETKNEVKPITRKPYHGYLQRVKPVDIRVTRRQ